ncbi:MAG TPA: ubiquinol-cytochrome c reductase iron-sulfur subunit N-terminal domain-containing protein, partial [Rhodocyclaceae bacterium]|nr:ubiquinol-cytochrome c reductase iron-sulfur subunit N-terminal domain-containing protein [Rhodocyclaceae bacterium]
MGCDEEVDCGRRRLIVATAAVGGVAGVVTVVPFVASM